MGFIGFQWVFIGFLPSFFFTSTCVEAEVGVGHGAGVPHGAGHGLVPRQLTVQRLRLDVPARRVGHQVAGRALAVPGHPFRTVQSRGIWKDTGWQRHLLATLFNVLAVAMTTPSVGGLCNCLTADAYLHS